MQLKQYQVECLKRLSAYFQKVVQTGSAKTAFVLETERPYYEVPQLPGLPYVCLRVPTGGGKTLLASHTVALASHNLLQVSKVVCLWLVPTNIIREQTLKALKDRSHPYRLALTHSLETDVTALDLSEAMYLSEESVSDTTVIIVSTLAALRVEDLEGRKIYEQSGALKPHFDNLQGTQFAQLDKWPNGAIITSLANVLRLHRPVVIVDEAHNARTQLSFETLARVAPSCILEYTATPELASDPASGRYASNVLHQVSAAELKVAEMVKLPVQLSTHGDWRTIVAKALDCQRHLEKVAAQEQSATGEYIRPILLFQAQQRSQQHETLTAEALKKGLIDDFRVPDDQIAIATGSVRELEDVDLSSSHCPIRFIITVQALREGWDCPFAYVLCSVADIHSSRAIEQLLGRVLRMPSATKKIAKELNFAYAFVTSSAFGPVVNSFQDALVENGFQRLEAADLIIPPGQLSPFFGARIVPVFSTLNLERLPATLRNSITFDPVTNTLAISGTITAATVASLRDCFLDAQSRAAIEALQIDEVPSAEPKPRISVPWLALHREDRLEIFEETAFRDTPWDLAKCDPSLPEADFRLAPAQGHSGEIDVTAEGRITTRFIEEVQTQLAMIEAEPGWTAATLALWLDRHIPHPDVPQLQSELYINRSLDYLIEMRQFSIDTLARNKFILADAIEARISLHRRTVERQAFQSFLFGSDSAKLFVDPALCFTFSEETYSPNWYYEGIFAFSKHCFRLVGELKSDGEEFQCAQFIDTLPEVKYWVRNLDRRPTSSFWLQTDEDKFYPDFVALLRDGRILVVEYKGAFLWSTDDSKTKRSIGELWAAKTNGKCLFVMPNGTDFEAIRRVVQV